MFELFVDRDATFPHIYVFAAVIVLVAALAARPYGRFLAAVSDLSWETRYGEPATEPQHPATRGPGADQPPAPDKTGTE